MAPGQEGAADSGESCEGPGGAEEGAREGEVCGHSDEPREQSGSGQAHEEDRHREEKCEASDKPFHPSKGGFESEKAGDVQENMEDQPTDLETSM